jgi:CubicO group peptidase (beta-lactamase class C family)
VPAGALVTHVRGGGPRHTPTHPSPPKPGAARDWARYGLLFLRDGVWVDGERILPAGWVDYSSTGSAADPGYGRHWRLDAGRDMYFATGFRNENVYIFPNLDLVITRHAMPQPIFFGWSQGAFLDGMLECFTGGNATSAH